MDRIHTHEKEESRNIDEVAGAFGEIMAEIFAYRQDEWEETLRRMGFFFGKFIYLMDAYEDIESDIKKNTYNPFKDIFSKEEFEDILMNRFDMSDLENMHATFEIANREKIKRQLHLDLRLYWLSDVAKLVSEEDADRICHQLTKDIVKHGKKYEDAIEEGRAQIVELLRE